MYRLCGSRSGCCFHASRTRPVARGVMLPCNNRNRSAATLPRHSVPLLTITRVGRLGFGRRDHKNRADSRSSSQPGQDRPNCWQGKRYGPGRRESTGAWRRPAKLSRVCPVSSVYGESQERIQNASPPPNPILAVASRCHRAAGGAGIFWPQRFGPTRARTTAGRLPTVASRDCGDGLVVQNPPLAWYLRNTLKLERVEARARPALLPRTAG